MNLNTIDTPALILEESKMNVLGGRQTPNLDA